MGEDNSDIFSVHEAASLDGRGFFVGASEAAIDFTARVRRLRAERQRAEDILQQQGEYQREELIFSAKEQIPESFFSASGEMTRKLYGFAHQALGFFHHPGGGFLFGGCAFGFPPDGFSLFVIRPAFRKRKKWLIYQRDELLAHELCHTVRTPLDSHRYEEYFAYQTAKSGLRRFLGGLFQAPLDAVLFLAGAFVPLLVQVLRLVRQCVWPQLPLWTLWVTALLFPLCYGWLLGRYWLMMHRIHRAAQIASEIWGEKGRMVLFRCTDEEIDCLARFNCSSTSLADVRKQVDAWIEEKYRWRVIVEKFGK